LPSFNRALVEQGAMPLVAFVPPVSGENGSGDSKQHEP
jgi:hypothetical protein